MRLRGVIKSIVSTGIALGHFFCFSFQPLATTSHQEGRRARQGGNIQNLEIKI
ncbi:hypothetical protein LZZ85_20880 [Terrimonas sp. NA20]|uniref:Uncharacterized protein n=1 Tax=Terrimonas ginsenosidimutans TaxID=2908004 RepID=A0ABS9KWN8_9BACT|nr:hypothetical protein [Terrimonas ginsenosidimutans]MCG2616767.1 hypothetical protein [Terrimonas ginsenosidimutans]